MCHEMPEGATPFIHSTIWSSGDPADLPEEVKPKSLSRFSVNKRIYHITVYGCVVYAMEPTSWGEMALVEQPPLRFLGRHQWKLVGTKVSAETDGLKEAIDNFPSSPDAPKKWEGLMEFRVFSVAEGYPALIAAENEVYIKVEYGKYLGVVSPPPTPYNRLFYKTVLAGYWLPRGVS
ncbi:hypothetical protein L6R29_18385 [Myxococcota bacterium]|nr:hypothetical protein [Myxococcota bacterium]